MVHSVTTRAVSTAIRALGVPLDIGFVFPPKPGQDRGFGQWTNRDLTPAEILAMLPRAGSANFRGGNIYMRLSPIAKSAHPGIIMLDDLSKEAATRLDVDGLQPCLTVETSAGNFQCWIRLIEEGTVDYDLANAVIRHLAAKYGADPRAVSPRQPGRLPGFTNRKFKHQRADGSYGFVTIAEARIGKIAEAGHDLLTALERTGTGRRAAGATPERPPMAARESNLDSGDSAALASLYRNQQLHIATQVDRGTRSPDAASASEVDFAFAMAAIIDGWSIDDVQNFIMAVRPTKAASYAARTLAAALRLIERRSLWPTPPETTEDFGAEDSVPQHANLP
jgi:hypothetical protein